jgi:hypothetical protein
MLNEFRKIKNWIIPYFFQRLKQGTFSHNPKHVFLCICDHFEPLWEKADQKKGLDRVKTWCEKYPEIAKKYQDSDGQIPKYTFFYPIEEYKPEYMELLADLCHRGYSEVEVHLHHDNDTAENLRKQLIDFKTLLADKYNLLSRDKETKEIQYGFIHGNWALNNCRPDGRMCGVDNELQVLRETGCYADFTMPSAPDITQPNIINSIYYADDLLMVQGPLMLNWKNRKWGIIPRIENGSLSYDCHITRKRINLWLKANIHIQEAPENVFIKLYTHGCQEKNIDYLLNNKGLEDLFSNLKSISEELNLKLHYVTAREIVNIVKAIENNVVLGDINTIRDYKLAKI